AARGEILQNIGCIHGAADRLVIADAEKKSAGGTVADVGRQKSALARFGLERLREVGEKENGDPEEVISCVARDGAVVRVIVDQVGVHCPPGVGHLAIRHEGFVQDVFVRHLVDDFGLEVKRIFRSENAGPGDDLRFHVAVYALELSDFCIGVIGGGIGIQNFIVSVVAIVNVAGGGGVVGVRVVIDRVGF